MDTSPQKIVVQRLDLQGHFFRTSRLNKQGSRGPPLHESRVVCQCRYSVVSFSDWLSCSFCSGCFQDSKPMPDMSSRIHRHAGVVGCLCASRLRLSIPSVAKSFFQLQTATLMQQPPSRYLTADKRVPCAAEPS